LTGALLANRPKSYPELLRGDFLPELEVAAKMADRFYSGRWMGDTVLERTIQFTANSSSFRSLMSDIFAGTQSYRGLPWRLYRILPRMLTESLVNFWSQPVRESEMESKSTLEFTNTGR
jgi:hypothetical protein